MEKRQRGIKYQSRYSSGRNREILYTKVHRYQRQLSPTSLPRDRKPTSMTILNKYNVCYAE